MKLTPVSGCDVQANSVVAHFVSISVSVRRRDKKKQRENIPVRPIGTGRQMRSMETETFSCFTTMP